MFHPLANTSMQTCSTPSQPLVFEVSACSTGGLADYTFLLESYNLTSRFYQTSHFLPSSFSPIVNKSYCRGDISNHVSSIFNMVLFGLPSRPHISHTSLQNAFSPAAGLPDISSRHLIPTLLVTTMFSALPIATPATYAAYLASWGPTYFSGRPLGRYNHATVLQNIDGVQRGGIMRRKKITKSRLAAGKRQELEVKTVEPWRVMGPTTHVPTSVRISHHS